MIDLLKIDNYIFHCINSGLSNTFFDILMPILRHKFTWIPVYCIILLYILKYFSKKSYLIIFIVLLNFSLTDFISNQVFKKNFKRIRPCNEITLEHNMIERVQCGSGFSFTSNHSANHFGLSFVLIFLGVFVQRNHKLLLIFWAIMVAFAQVYVGVHYPFDVIIGAFLGIFIAYIVSFLSKKIILKRIEIN